MMKRLLTIVLLLLVGSTAALAQKHGSNVLGAPVYYDTLGNVIGREAVADSFYHRPKHHFLNRLENDYSSIFVEGTIQFGGNDFALGGQAAWVPQRWGLYCGGQTGVRHNYFTVGPVIRLSDCGHWVDWQLYAGMVFSRHVGGEIGVRMAAPRRWGDFCWSSGSLAVGYVNGYNYFTLGFSLAFSPVVAVSIW